MKWKEIQTFESLFFWNKTQLKVKNSQLIVLLLIIIIFVLDFKV